MTRKTLAILAAVVVFGQQDDADRRMMPLNNYKRFVALSAELEERCRQLEARLEAVEAHMPEAEPPDEKVTGKIQFFGIGPEDLDALPLAERVRILEAQIMSMRK